MIPIRINQSVQYAPVRESYLVISFILMCMYVIDFRRRSSLRQKLLILVTCIGHQHSCVAVDNVAVSCDEGIICNCDRNWPPQTHYRSTLHPCESTVIVGRGAFASSTKLPIVSHASRCHLLVQRHFKRSKEHTIQQSGPTTFHSASYGYRLNSHLFTQINVALSVAWIPRFICTQLSSYTFTNWGCILRSRGGVFDDCHSFLWPQFVCN